MPFWFSIIFLPPIIFSFIPPCWWCCNITLSVVDFRCRHCFIDAISHYYAISQIFHWWYVIIFAATITIAFHFISFYWLLIEYFIIILSHFDCISFITFSFDYAWYLNIFYFRHYLFHYYFIFIFSLIISFHFHFFASDFLFLAAAIATLLLLIIAFITDYISIFRWCHFSPRFRLLPLMIIFTLFHHVFDYAIIACCFFIIFIDWLSIAMPPFIIFLWFLFSIAADLLIVFLRHILFHQSVSFLISIITLHISTFIFFFFSDVTIIILYFMPLHYLIALLLIIFSSFHFWLLISLSDAAYYAILIFFFLSMIAIISAALFHWLLLYIDYRLFIFAYYYCWCHITPFLILLFRFAADIFLHFLRASWLLLLSSLFSLFSPAYFSLRSDFLRWWYRRRDYRHLCHFLIIVFVYLFELYLDYLIWCRWCRHIAALYCIAFYALRRMPPCYIFFGAAFRRYILAPYAYANAACHIAHDIF